MSDTTLLTRKQAAHYLTRLGCRIAAKTLENLASATSPRRGPSYYKNGNRTMYDPIDLDTWRRKRLVRVEQ